MKILHFSTSDKGGAGLCCLRIHQSLIKAGIESKMVVLYNTRQEVEEYRYGYIKHILYMIPSFLFRLLRLKVTKYNRVKAISEKYHTFYTLPTSPNDLSKSEWIEWADIIHLHWVDNYLDFPSFFKKVRKPIIWTLHDEGLFYGIAHHHKNILEDNVYERKAREIKFESVRRAKSLSIVFLSQMMSQNFVNEKIIEGRKSVVINNSVNPNVFFPLDKNEMRRKYGLKPHIRCIVFISVNIADPNKGLDLLSKVLWDIDTSAIILAIGGNPWQREWQNVYSVGRVTDQSRMHEYISCGDYMAMPSYQEAFSQSPLEAMACGLPVIVFPVSGTKELVRESNGIICEGFTETDLKKGIVELFSRKYNPSEIRKDVIERFSPEVIAKKYIMLYQEVISKKC